MNRTLLRVFLCSIICSSSTAWSAEKYNDYIRSAYLQALLGTKVIFDKPQLIREKRQKDQCYSSSCSIKLLGTEVSSKLIRDENAYYRFSTDATKDSTYLDFKDKRKLRNTGFSITAACGAVCALSGWLWFIKEYRLLLVPTILAGACTSFCALATYNDHKSLLKAQSGLGKLKPVPGSNLLEYRFYGPDIKDIFFSYSSSKFDTFTDKAMFIQITEE